MIRHSLAAVDTRGIFARYILAQVDLPAVSGVTVGGFQAGLGLRVVF